MNTSQSRMVVTKWEDMTQKKRKRTKNQIKLNARQVPLGEKVLKSDDSENENIDPQSKRCGNDATNAYDHYHDQRCRKKCIRSQRKHKRTASITDLGPEDRKKVASLIHELANLGSEKEKVEKLLEKERLNFENAIKELVSDQKSLLTERQNVQLELKSCQQMLNQLQEVVLRGSTAVSDSQSASNLNIDDVMSNNKVSQFDKMSALDEYISGCHSVSELEPVDRTHEVKLRKKRDLFNDDNFDGGSTADGGESSTSFLHQTVGDSASTVDYSTKDDLSSERTRLLEEQKLLKQKLLEHEALLQQTQMQLRKWEQENRIGKFNSYLSKSAPNSGNIRMSPRMTLTKSQSGSSSTLSNSSHMGQSHSRKTPATRQGHITHSYDVGIQVASPVTGQMNVSNQGNEFRNTKDTSVQAELPINSKCYVGNRLVPSPRDNVSRNGALDETLERTSRLLKSAKKIIDDASSPVMGADSNCGNISPSSIRGTLRKATPRKTPQQLFDISDTTLASEINSDAIFAMNDLDTADKTETEIIEDVFYVK